MTAEANQLFTGEPVGAELTAIRHKLLDALRDLETLRGGGMRKRLAPAKERLKSSVVKVAVIGQMKAGKSSLINALIRKTDFLPADVNPWTSVVTHLYFGHPSGKVSGAIFRFFDEVQWQRLATRGGMLGELTEGLLEDYKREQLFEQVEAMRERARLRLSEKFESLLGKAHRFDSVSPAILARYVCAGDNPEKRIFDPTAGRFSDITRAAEVYSPMSPFGCPVCIIDTPGINDPLLIREEITQQSLESADYFVIVLSAHQSLTKTDMRLIRVLRALNRERIIIFVNRVDEIHNPERDFDKLRERVRAQISKELDGKDVTVILGSAAWADFALTGDEEVLDRNVLSAFVAARGLADSAHALDPDRTIADSARAEAFVASGMHELEAALSDTLMNGPAACDLVETADDLLAVARQAVEQCNIRLFMLETKFADFEPLLEPSDKERLSSLTALNIKKAHDGMIAAIAATFAQIKAELRSMADAYATEQTTVIRTEMAALSRGQNYSCNLDPLRHQMDKVYFDAFTRLRTRLLSDLIALDATVKQQLGTSVIQRMTSMKIGTMPLTSQLPDTDPLFRTATLDLSKNWLTSLFGVSAAKIATATQTIRTQFTTISAEIAEAGRSQLSQVTSRLTDEFEQDLERFLDALAGQTANGESYSEQEAHRRKAEKEAAEADLSTARALVISLNELQSPALLGNAAA